MSYNNNFGFGGGGYGQYQPNYGFSSQGSGRLDMYKSRSNQYFNQDQRRNNLQYNQKMGRADSHNQGRPYMGSGGFNQGRQFGFNQGGDQWGNQKQFNSFPKYGGGKPKQQNNQAKKKARPKVVPKPREYKNILCTSDYLFEKPEDFEQWIIVACPKGKRCTIVAQKGQTKMYDKSGKFVKGFQSDLPGGFLPDDSNCTLGGSRKTILDCVFCEENNSYYVLDLLMWNLYPFLECEASLRFFWLETHLTDANVDYVSRTNDFRFLPAVRFEVIHMQPYLLAPHVYPGNQPQVDGFLFYHPEEAYVSGTTPLVGWLKGFMIPDLIDHIQLHPAYTAEKPANYTTLQEYALAQEASKQESKKKKKGKGKQGQKTEEQMETTDDN